MAVYDFDITSTEVLAVVGFSPTAGNADPTTAQIDLWIKQFCGRVINVMLGVGVTASAITSSADGPTFHDARGAIIGRCASAWLIANQREMGDFAEHLINEYNGYLASWRTRPSYTAGATGHSMTPRFGSSTALTSAEAVDPDRQSLWIDKTTGFG
jgi:hypothetical protein